MKTIVGLFDDFQHAQTAVDELMRSGVNRDDINLIANDTEGKLKEYTAGGHEHTAAKGGAGTGAVLGGLAGLAVGVGALVIPGIGPVITAGTLASALASTAAGAGIGAVAGGVLGALVHVGVPEEEAQSYAEGLRRGGTLVTAKVDDTIAPRAQQILQRNNMVDVKQRETTWRQQGWQGYDAKAKPYTSDELRREREQWSQSRGSQTMNQTGGSGQTMNQSRGSQTMNQTSGSEQTMSQSRGTMQSGGDFATMEPTYRSDFQSRYGTGKRRYEDYAPAYRYGYELANDQRYQNQDWNTVEQSARTDWERRGSGSWQDFKDAIRYAWDQARGKRY